MKRTLLFSLIWIFSSFACTSPSVTSIATTQVDTAIPTNTAFVPAANSATLPVLTATHTASPTFTPAFTETPLSSETPSPIPSNTSLPTVESIPARVTADRLSCRYGPGPEYLYLFAFRAGANIELIGRVDAQNWDWVLVENKVPCWVRADYLEMQGERLSLPVMYPGVAKLPITPYYPASEILSAKRDPLTNEVSVSWVDVPVSLGDYEDDSMQTYLIEAWRCQSGELIFDPLATRSTFITFVDEPGCAEASHGRVWVQEKHGYAGPAEIPWPE